MRKGLCCLQRLWEMIQALPLIFWWLLLFLGSWPHLSSPSVLCVYSPLALCYKDTCGGMQGSPYKSRTIPSHNHTRKDLLFQSKATFTSSRDQSIDISLGHIWHFSVYHRLLTTVDMEKKENTTTKLSSYTTVIMLKCISSPRTNP